MLPKNAVKILFYVTLPTNIYLCTKMSSILLISVLGFLQWPEIISGIVFQMPKGVLQKFWPKFWNTFSSKRQQCYVSHLNRNTIPVFRDFLAFLVHITGIFNFNPSWSLGFLITQKYFVRFWWNFILAKQYSSEIIWN